MEADWSIYRETRYQCNTILQDVEHSETKGNEGDQRISGFKTFSRRQETDPHLGVSGDYPNRDIRWMLPYGLLTHRVSCLTIQN